MVQWVGGCDDSGVMMPQRVMPVDAVWPRWLHHNKGDPIHQQYSGRAVMMTVEKYFDGDEEVIAKMAVQYSVPTDKAVRWAVS